MINSKEKVAVLFTGGRDSSLVACLEASQGKEVHLLTCNSGIGIRSDLSEIRLEELKNRFPEQITGRTILPTFGLFRSIATSKIEADFRRWGVNLVLLGDKLAIHAAATVYCLNNGITRLVDGCVGYQKELAEQKNIAIELFTEFELQYGITYDCPIYNLGTQDDVKYTLMLFGLSSKSLEGVSVFGDAFSEPTDIMIKEYMSDKFPICHNYISLMTKTSAYIKATKDKAAGKKNISIIKIGAAIIRDNQLLVVSTKKNPHCFILPGGKLEDNETDIECLTRELNEELGVTILWKSYLGEYKTTAMLENEILILRVYIAGVCGEFVPANEIVSYKWIAIDSQESDELGTGITKFTLPSLRKDIPVWLKK